VLKRENSDVDVETSLILEYREEAHYMVEGDLKFLSSELNMIERCSTNFSGPVMYTVQSLNVQFTRFIITIHIFVS